jgi:carboxymethylenebutenolidase
MRARWAILVLLGALLATGTRLNAAVKTQTVTYQSGNETVSGYLAVPSTPGKHPALILIHEWWGLVPWAKDQAKKFAAAGYVALAVDLYRGKTTDDPKVAREMATTLPADRAMRDLEAAFDFLAARNDVEANKIGTVGWCFGGGWALRLATHEPRMAACAINYGELTTDPAAIDAIRCPVLANFGAEDTVIPPAKVRAFEAAMKKAGKSIDVKIYPGAGHAFETSTDKTRYRPAASADAWKRMIAFFQRTLGARAGGRRM